MGKLRGWLAAPFAGRALVKARNILTDATPLNADCGRLCGAACCQPDETGENGMLLWPYEDQLYRRPIDGFPFRLAEDERWYKGGKRLVCQGHCPRAHRPLACRVFPLRMRLTTGGAEGEDRVTAEIDPRAWATCPLPEAGGLRAVSGAFIKAVEAAGQALCRNVYLLEALLEDQRRMDELRRL